MIKKERNQDIHQVHQCSNAFQEYDICSHFERLLIIVIKFQNAQYNAYNQIM